MRGRVMKRIGKLIIICCLLFVVVGCKNIFEVEPEPEKVYLTGKHYVEMSIKNYGKLELELDADKAPITVTNFMELVNSGAYNGNKIHRVAKDFVIQGGQLADAKTIKGEFLANGVDNDISHERGVISMARGGDQTSGYDTGSSQFFICTKDVSESLDNYYAAFGKVTKGMDIVDRINRKVTNTDDIGNILKEAYMPIIEYIKEIEK
jgi:peptidyl-prolyl cis-trans isomerase B (cyclophilin B)